MGSRTVTAKTGAASTAYSGVTFRSRLEARWALFFDCVGWDWDYEPCLYRVTRKMSYLPDFFLPGLGLWVEVKGAYYLKASSMAKIACSVAGRHRIPLRCPPYGPADRILLAGDMLPQTLNYQPLHTLIADAGGLEAVAMNCVLDVDGPHAVGDPWLSIPATGHVASAEPAPDICQELCAPGTRLGRAPAPLADAYIVASQPMGRSHELALSPELRNAVKGRRGGRRVR
jgi:hypothetical protein